MTKTTKRLTVTCLLLIPCATAFGWGSGHDTVARETLRVLPGVWGERLRAVEDDCCVLDKTEEGKSILRKTVDAAVRSLRKETPAAAEVWEACFADELKGMGFYRYDLDLAHGGAKAHDFLATRSIHDDAITRGLVPSKGGVPEVGVLYDPTGSWTRGIVYMANRSFSAQICTTLRKRRKAGLLDIRSVMRDGVPDGVKTVVFAASGFGGYQGFSASDVSRALAAFMRRGGRLVLADGRSFTCVRPPKGGSGWYWGQLGLSYVPPQTLPEGGREVLGYVSKDGRKTLVGYTVGNRTFLPAFALFPYVFTDETPCCNPLKLELDAAGSAVLESVL